MSTRRTPHTLEIADHLWEALEAMAVEMDADPRVLVNQALFNFVRINGYFVPGSLARAALEPTASGPVLEEPPRPEAPAAAAPVAPRPAAAPMATSVTPRLPAATPPRPEPAVAPPPPVEAKPAAAARREKPADPDADPLRIAQARRVAEIQDAVAKLTVPVPDRDLLEKDDEEEEVEEDEVEDEDENESEDEAEPEEDDEEDTEAEPHAEDRVPIEAGAEGTDERTLIGVTLKRKLFVTVDGARPMEIATNRFVIGRDPSCDLVINSDKLSRQHAAVKLDASGAELEDLGSSNGTWYAEERIAARDIDDGDEFFLGDVKLTFEFRS